MGIVSTLIARRNVLVGLLLFFCVHAVGLDLGKRNVTMWRPFLEWTLENPSCDGNPFDLEASARFGHVDSGATHVTEMFFAGKNQWRFRFSGSLAGTWTFVTSSADPGLDGHTGSITVTPNSDPQARGFLTHAGNKFAIQEADAKDLRGHLFQVYMNQHIVTTNFEAFADPGLLTTYLNDVQANGFDTAFTYLNHNWFKLGVLRHDEHDKVNPDLETFEILDQIITSAHARGMRWHFWAWGDESRKWTPHGLPGGVNGAVDRRLQRYIAARLGPLPGWSMGYGFDLVEWTSEKGRNGWARYLHEKMGWDHLLCTRGFKLSGSDNNIIAYSGFGGNDLTTTKCGPADFAEVARHMDANPNAPSLYEERHSYLRNGFQLDMDGTRHLRWWQAMSGGMGGFYGFYAKSEHPYPNPEQLRTFHRFWKSRYDLDLNRADTLSEACVLQSDDKQRLVLYQEKTGAITVDLSGIPKKLPVIAVDAAKEYEEIALDSLVPGKQAIALPHASDWAIAIGDFSDEQ
jgi:hypothetical protein